MDKLVASYEMRVASLSALVARSSKLAAIFALFFNCDPQLTDDPIPFVAFTEEVLNLNLPENLALRSDKGYREINNKGVRGIIVYRLSSTDFRAYERNCSFQPNEACATVNVHSSGLYLTDPCCSSSFSIDEGTPTGGPAWRPLRQYRTQLSGSTLTITDEIVD